MHWRCPACDTEIRHDPMESRPNPQASYRCHVCRLDLRFNDTLSKMEIAPLDDNHAVAPERERPRTLPPPMPTGKRKSPKRK